MREAACRQQGICDRLLCALEVKKVRQILIWSSLAFKVQIRTLIVDDTGVF